MGEGTAALGGAGEGGLGGGGGFRDDREVGGEGKGRKVPKEGLGAVSGQVRGPGRRPCGEAGSQRVEIGPLAGEPM